MRREHLVGLFIIAALAGGCGGKSKEAVEAYLGHLSAGRYEAAYQMLSANRRGALSQARWRASMHTDRLADVQDFSVMRSSSSGAGQHCLQTELDFASHPDRGPLGFYVFYLVDEGGIRRIHDVLTYSRIDGMVAHFDQSREPFACHNARL